MAYERYVASFPGRDLTGTRLEPCYEEDGAPTTAAEILQGLKSRGKKIRQVAGGHYEKYKVKCVGQQGNVQTLPFNERSLQTSSCSIAKDAYNQAGCCGATESGLDPSRMYFPFEF